MRKKKRKEKKKTGRLGAKQSRPGELEPSTTAMYLGYGNPSGNARAVQFQKPLASALAFSAWLGTAKARAKTERLLEGKKKRKEEGQEGLAVG